MIKKIIVIFLFNLLYYPLFSQEIIDKVVAVVGERPILYSEIQGQKLQIAQQGNEIDENTDCLLIVEFMTQQLLIQQAEIDSLEVTEDMVKMELDQRIQYFSNQVGGTEALEDFYEKSIEEIKEEFFEQIEDKMKAQKMQQEITGNINASPKEVMTFFRNIPFDSVPYINSKVKISQLVLAPEITYEQKNYTKNKLRKIKNRIKSNEISFSVAAEFYSNDPGSKANGGNFGWVDRGDFVQEFDAIAYNIPLNTISDVFESPFGFHILKVEKRRGEQYYGSHILIKNEISELELRVLKERCDSILFAVSQNKNSWEKAIVQNSTNSSSKGIIFNQSSGDMYWDMQNIDKSLFIGINNLEIGEYSEPLYYEDEKGNMGFRILKLEDRTKPHKANLNDDYEFIKKYAVNEKQVKEMDKWVTKIVKNSYIKIDDLYKGCPKISKWNLNF
ncbi:MAG: peptidylprolyl isomerase [Flavobacteriales bacterium]|nr:peptidylprolyl isomerase [Flavobacteriales bacterium]